jgi:antitoxin HigA-1
MGLKQPTSIMKTIIKVNIMRMHNPPHPGEILREFCIEPLDLSVTRAAEALGVSRKTLSAILNGRAGISPEMAIRLSKAFGTSAESWLNQQVQYDLWLAEQNSKDMHVEQLSAA